MNEPQKLNDQVLAPPRGTRDFTPAQAKTRLNVVNVIREQFEAFGFVPLETPAFENYAVLSAKFAGGEEILKETYRFTDSGGRDLGLRYDFTVPLCRYVATTLSLPKPFKRYTIGPVWRDGPLKSGRYREFTQCDVDTIGAPLPIADAELISLAYRIFNKLGLKVRVKLNSRKLLGALMEKAGVKILEKQLEALLVLDKLEKVGWQQVENEWVAKGMPKESLDLLKTMVMLPNDNTAKLFELKGKINSPQGDAAVLELQTILEYCSALGCEKSVAIEPTLARGLNYYTGAIFECVLENGALTGLTSSLAAGGRYDDLIAKYSTEAGRTNAQPTPAVGISFGLDILVDALLASTVSFSGKPNNLTYVLTIDLPLEGARISNALREQSVPCMTDLLSRSLAKNFEAAAKAGAKFAIILGPTEVEAKKVKLRDMTTGNEVLLDLDSAINRIKTSA